MSNVYLHLAIMLIFSEHLELSFFAYTNYHFLHVFIPSPTTYICFKVDYQTFNSPKEYWDKVMGKIKEFSATMIEVRPFLKNSAIEY